MVITWPVMYEPLEDARNSTSVGDFVGRAQPLGGDPVFDLFLQSRSRGRRSSRFR